MSSTTHPVTELNEEALNVLAEAGISAQEWIAYGNWRDVVVDQDGKRQWGPRLTEWHGDVCGCTDDRCIGYHHDEHEECGCLPALIKQRAEEHEGYAIWQDYRAAVEANNGQGDPEAQEAVWARVEAWVRRYFPNVETFSLDAVVKGRRGISGTYPLRGRPVPEWATPDADGYRILLWGEGVDQDGYVIDDTAK